MVFPNNHSRWNTHAMVDDAPVQPRPATYFNIRQQHRPVNFGVGMNAARREEQGAVHFTRNDASASNRRLDGKPMTVNLVVHKLGGG